MNEDTWLKTSARSINHVNISLFSIQAVILRFCKSEHKIQQIELSLMGFNTTPASPFSGITFKDYQLDFPYQGDALYLLLFERNKNRIKAKKADVAAANLKKIFNATFTLSAKIGFHEMSLRDLSKETGISMGGLYSCITKKEDIASMVLDIVEQVITNNNTNATQEKDELVSLEMAIKYHLYASTLLQPWFFFLYFETRCLSDEDQIRSKKIELSIISTLERTIRQGLDKGNFHVSSPYFVAQTIVVVLQDWYLKPWKNKQQKIGMEQYSDYLFIMVKKLLMLNENL
jgi:AcrR family transcriptional regulator